MSYEAGGAREIEDQHGTSPTEIAIGVVIGRSSEFFDFFVYAIASVLVFPRIMFPFAEPFDAMIWSFAIFALAFIARPFGTLIFMAIDRRWGRGVKLTLALFLLGCSTAGIAFMFGSGCLHSAYFTTLQRGYAAGDLSVVYPLARGTGPALSVLAAVLILGERPGPIALFGAAIIVVAVISLAFAGHATPSRAAIGFRARSTFSFSSRTASGSKAAGGSMATRQSSCRM